YEWSSVKGFSSSMEDISGLEPDTYMVNVTDANGCSATKSIILGGGVTPYTISATMITASCKGNDGSIDFTVIGGTQPFTYSWTGPYGYTFDGQDPTGIGGGTYTVVVSDANNRTLSLPVVGNQINSTLAPSWSVVDAFCSPNSGSIDLGVVGGDRPYSYAWSNGATTQDINNVSPGFYTVIITDAKECRLRIDDIEVG